MPKVSSINVKYRGGFRGFYVNIKTLISKSIPLDIVDFEMDKSCVRGCSTYCRMQIKINGKPYVTWHSSEILAQFLSDCKAHQEETGEVTFPVEQCIISVGDDKGFYLADAPENAYIPSESEMEKLCKKKK